MATTPTSQIAGTSNSGAKPKKSLYTSLWALVIFAVLGAILLGYFLPRPAMAMKPFGDGFIKLISMIISPVIFCTVVSGIAGMGDMKKVGRVGGKALIYFEAVSTLALFFGLFIGNVLHPGSGFNVNPASLDARAVAQYAGTAKTQSVTQFLLQIIPRTFASAFAKGDILEVLLVAILVGFAISAAGPRCKPLVTFFDALTKVVFGIVNILMWIAPLGAFGAVAFTVGKYGIGSLGPLAKLILCFYLTAILFVLIFMGAIARLAGFGIVRFLLYLKDEILLVMATSSSEVALPLLMEKMEKLGCSQTLVGLVVPAGYTFNTDGSNLYMTLAALFVAQATNTHLSFAHQLTILLVATLTSKGATGVQGASFVALVGTLMVIPSIPVAGMALILGVDRFMSMVRGTVNVIGNGLATVVVSRWEKELDRETLRAKLT